MGGNSGRRIGANRLRQEFARSAQRIERWPCDLSKGNKREMSLMGSRGPDGVGAYTA